MKSLIIALIDTKNHQIGLKIHLSAKHYVGTQLINTNKHCTMIFKELALEFEGSCITYVVWTVHDRQQINESD